MSYAVLSTALLVLVTVVAGVLAVALFRARRRVAHREERFRSIVETTGEGVWVIDGASRTVYVNPRMTELLGYTAGEMLGRSSFDFVFPEDLPRSEQGWEERRNAPGPRLAEWRLRRKDGSSLWTLANTSFLPAGSTAAGPAHVLGMFSDITELRIAARDRDRFFELSLDLLCILTPDQRPVQLNSAWERTLGFTVPELMTMSHRDLIHPDDLAASDAEGEKVRRGGSTVSFENRYRTRDGSYRWLLWSVVSDPEDGRIYGVARDVTESRRVLQELREADRRKDEFLAMLAHELRNPLAPILNATQVLHSRTEGEPLLVRQTELIERQARQMARLVDDLLDVSRVTRGKIDLRKRPVELAGIVEEAVQASTAIVERRGQELAVTLPPHPIWLHADAGRLVQSLCNLLTNAAKYSERGGRIELAAREEGDEAVLSVKDRGRGIPAEVLPHVFDLFVQADRALDRSEGGLGIGLTLVRSLVEMHGGSVAAASEGEGQGSELTIRLPRLLAGAGEPCLPASAVDEARLAAAPRRVLIVDDNLDAAESAAELVALWGHEARVAHDGPTALGLSGSFRPDVVLLDIGLPGMDGYEVARRLRAAAGGEELLLVAVTGYGQAEDRQRALAHGFDFHLTKPVDPPTVRSLLEAPAEVPRRAPERAALPAVLPNGGAA